MEKKVYFAGSIRAGRTDARLYQRMIDYIQRTERVLTEHVGNPELNLLERGRGNDALIYEQDITWLQESDLVIAECTSPSLGVGYELAYAEKLSIPCCIFYDRTKTQLSAMLTGNSYFQLFPYEKECEIYPLLDMILNP